MNYKLLTDLAQLSSSLADVGVNGPVALEFHPADHARLEHVLEFPPGAEFHFSAGPAEIILRERLPVGPEHPPGTRLCVKCHRPEHDGDCEQTEVRRLRAYIRDAVEILRKPKHPHARAEGALALLDAALDPTR